VRRKPERIIERLNLPGPSSFKILFEIDDLRIPSEMRRVTGSFLELKPLVSVAC
jgi:hypothetical protein